MELETDISNQAQQPEPSLKEKTAKGLFWGGISTFIQQFIGMVFGIVIARILSPGDYGLIAMLAIFTAIASTIMDSGFSIALINRRTIDHKDYNAVFWFNIVFGIGLYIILFFTAPFIADFFNQPVLKSLSRILFLNFVIASAGIAHNAILLKKIMAKQRGIIDIVSVLFSGAVGLTLALKGFAFWGLAIQQITYMLITLLLRWYFSPWKPTFHFDFSPLKEMFGFSIKLFFTNLIMQITQHFLSVIFGRIYRETETGYYAQGYKWGSLGTSIFANMFNSVAQPVLINAIDDKERQKNIFRKLVRFGAFVSFPCLLCLASVGEEFILIFLGEKWFNSLPYLQLFCFWGSVSFLWYLYTNLLFTYNKSNIYMWVIIALSIFQIVAVLSFHSFGIIAMVIVFICCNFIGLFVWHYFVNKMIGLRLWNTVKDILPYLISAIGCIVVSWLLTKGIDNIYVRFFLKTTITFALYAVIMWYSNSVIVKECYNFIKYKGTKI